MKDLVDRAQSIGGCAAYPNERAIVRIPAGCVVEFCRAELALGHVIDFAECLYEWGDGGIQPSMELSGDRADFGSDEDYLAFLARVAKLAMARSELKSAAAVFEVGFSKS